MPSISLFCSKCKKYNRWDIQDGIELTCTQCRHTAGKIDDAKDVLDRCPVCTCRQFYTDKDFNQIIGFAVMAVGIVLVPLTFGLSLPVFALIDWLIYKKVPRLIACYRCGTEYRGFDIPERFKPFRHEIGLHYDKYR